MAQYRLTKRAIVLIVVLFLLIAGGVGGYLYWRLVINDQTVAPTESEAGGGAGACCDPEVGCVAGYTCTGDPCTPEGTAGEYPIPSGCGSLPDCVSCGNGRCRVGIGTASCNNGLCYYSSGETSLKTCVLQQNTDPTEGDCAAFAKNCEWPTVLMSGRNDPAEDLCRCEECTGKIASDPYSCTGNPPKCTPDACPTGYVSCGDSTSMTDVEGCTKMTDLYCVVNHPDCGNPTYIYRYCRPEGTNVCETGGITSPAASSEYEVGDVINIVGWAADEDGIDATSVKVSINGTEVGTADVESACAPDNADPALCTSQGSDKHPVVWTYNYTVVATGAIAISVVWEDSKGVTGANCAASRSVTADQENPDWEITKTGANVCIDETEGAMEARVDYTISITNIGAGAGQLTELKDTLDAKVQSSYIQTSSIDPTATVSGNEITWDLDGALGTFTAGQTKTFVYSIIVPEAAFGTYSNTAEATPDSGPAFSATEVVYVGCDVPDTGLFDSLISKVALGLVLIGAGIMYVTSKSTALNKMTMGVASGIEYISSPEERKRVKRSKFERKVAGK